RLWLHGLHPSPGRSQAHNAGQAASTRHSTQIHRDGRTLSDRDVIHARMGGHDESEIRLAERLLDWNAAQPELGEGGHMRVVIGKLCAEVPQKLEDLQSG